ncbi:hypothetical protein F0U60_47130 [Archangium minus]|uniref:Uncharacterized protein n=1 Tax=Archangium minus TaxID=83450 RepID=A0ABY9X637_9BACT|nr:hypothetical protein F0U60_47130 [Archangium minus]
MREGINGYFSLGMAYRLRAEGVTPDVLKAIVDRIEKIGSAHMPNAPQPGQKISEKAQKEVASLWTGKESGALAELRDGLAPWFTVDWMNFAACALHFERIMKQLALVTMPRPELSED